ncbi:MAG: Asp/Glu/hydantoin racemase [Gammaproteobacteria bacterium]|jgi:Asp/Glu/hydantoin racemase
MSAPSNQATAPTPRIALVHALSVSVAPITDAFAAHWPQARTFSLMDDSLSVDLAADGAITDAMTQRFIDLSRYCASTGASAVQFTCSAFGECIDAARNAVDIPVLKPDEAMIEEAFTYGPRLGAVVTFEPSVQSVCAQIDGFAAKIGVRPQLDLRVAEGALDALRAGDVAQHDRLIAQTIASLGPCDVVMLGQYSMARAAPLARTVSTTPLLSAPEAAVRHLRELLTSAQGA